MINRRHIRVKVLQSFYAITHSQSDNIVKEEKFLRHSIDKMYELYALSLDLIVRVNQLAEQRIENAKKKYLATDLELNPNTRFVDNKVITLLKESESLKTYLEENNLNNWYLDSKYVSNIYEDLMSSTFYKKYMEAEENDFKKDVKFVVKFFSKFIAPNEQLEEYFEGTQISWVDDIPFVNSWVVKTLQSLKQDQAFVLNRLYKNEEDKNFVSDLFKRVVLNHTTYDELIAEKTPNWEVDRIADVDILIIKMAMAEFEKFPSIPVKASINEYLEIAKDYSTEKSSYFINGVLDKVQREWTDEQRINKIGRGKL